MLETVSSAMRRVYELLQLYGSPSASAAELLCDRHDPAKIANRVIIMAGNRIGPTDVEGVLLAHPIDNRDRRRMIELWHCPDTRSFRPSPTTTRPMGLG